MVPDEVPAIVPRSARLTEARWVAKYRWAALTGDLAAALTGVTLALVGRFGAPSRLRGGDVADVAVDTSALHFFDPGSGLGIYDHTPEGAAA